MPAEFHDFCIIGGGIVGLATALRLHEARPEASILILEKENALGKHQTAHNSGVIHAGIYYKPGSFKAALCRRGAAEMKVFCTRHSIPFKSCGKLVVATHEGELERLGELAINAGKNEIEVHTLDERALRELEPNVVGKAALLIPQSGIVDYGRVCAVMGEVLRRDGVSILLNTEVTHFQERQDHVEIQAGNRRWLARQLVVCGGLQADRLAKMGGLPADFRIVPFRGEYYAVRPEKHDFVRHMIYPVPDPSLPFLGIHLTPTIDGELTVGPNAVLGFSREGYLRNSVNLTDLRSVLSFPGFWKMTGQHWRSGLTEMGDSYFKSRYVRKVQRYCPAIVADDLVPLEAGIRAQAIDPDGTLQHDFVFLSSKRTLHVGNAPSPAATSSLAIGQMVVERLLDTEKSREPMAATQAV